MSDGRRIIEARMTSYKMTATLDMLNKHEILFTELSRISLTHANTISPVTNFEAKLGTSADEIYKM
jgi:hypothetical protein